MRTGKNQTRENSVKKELRGKLSISICSQYLVTPLVCVLMFQEGAKTSGRTQSGGQDKGAFFDVSSSEPPSHYPVHSSTTVPHC